MVLSQWFRKRPFSYVMLGLTTFVVARLFYPQIVGYLMPSADWFKMTLMLAFVFLAVASRPSGENRVNGIFLNSQAERVENLKKSMIWTGILVAAITLFSLLLLLANRVEFAEEMFVWAYFFTLVVIAWHFIPEPIERTPEMESVKGEIVQKKEILVIGPSQVGKTGMLASLEHACHCRNKDDFVDGWDVSINAESPEMHSHFREVTKTIKEGRLPFRGDTDIRKFSFNLRLAKKKAKVLFGRENISTTFTFNDVAGGIVFSEEKDNQDLDALKSKWENLIECGRNSDGIIICIDPDPGKDQALRLFQDIPRFLSDLGHDIRCRQLVFCLMKADKFFAKNKKNSWKNAKSENPVRVLEDTVIPGPLKNRIMQFANDAKISIIVGFTSSYGFIENGVHQGEPNYISDEKTDTLRLYKDFSPREIINNWRPFQVLDPFIFFASGMRGGFVPFEND